MQFGGSTLYQFDGILAQALGYEENNYEGLPDAQGEAVHSQHSIRVIGQDMRRIVEGNINAYFQQGEN